MTVSESESDEPGGSGTTSAVPRGSGGVALTDAAREVFAERGYHGASIRDVAKRAGLSLSALYYWHSGKQELLAALLEDGVNDYFRTCESALRTTEADPASRLCALVRATVDYRVRRRVDSTIAAQEFRNLEQPHAQRLVTLRESATRLWQDIIDEGVRDDVFRCAYPRDARRAIQAACNAIAQWYAPDGDVEPGELAERYVSIALRIVDRAPQVHDRRKASAPPRGSTADPAP
ncbi:AcrR family transcriptional regulator [Saccharopolyspora lacisalsi]|uniref:AcrR family transcriptional regulator n=1 Tax=Halosaccharopolyspora lacisalsi TaxID=1000566 RepID=A0A839E5M1_9PSEU|nr:TetR/AcrR family transcriptional regulator [Halosaccharopolyspora lacisalsi]MBA8826188.1 AcrR family transcriptional regulator [Halosaccharopolyspora lacisalsi]